MTKAVAIALVLGGIGLGAPRAALSQSAVTVPSPAGDVTVLADRFEEIRADNLIVATGNVEIVRGSARLLADRVEINRATGDAVALGRVLFYDGDNRLTGDRIDFNVNTGTGVVYRGEARAGPYYRIAGDRMERLGESVYRVRRGVFTTCEDDSPTWSFRFGSATADLEDFVWGTNASFWVKDVPLLPFLPFFAAAIRRERQTGFLFPRIGQSSRKGVWVEAPFFWAISDSQDATVSLSAFERRGFGGSAEYRYVLSERQRGEARGFWVRETQRENDDRGYGSFKHDWQVSPGFSLRADVNLTSDDLVLREYVDSIAQRSAQRAESNLWLTRTWGNWNLVGNAFFYQDLTVSRPVELQRLPSIRLEGLRQPMPGIPGLLYQLDTSATHYVRDVGSDGTRVDVHPRLSYPIGVGGFFTVTPFVGGRLTGYDRRVVGHRITRVENHTVEVTEDEVRLRRLLEFGGDVETRASRVYQVDGFGGVGAVLHTVEPRVSYVRIAGENFSSLPNWNDLVDRIPEASWLEYSLINRALVRSAGPAGTGGGRQEVVRLQVAHAYDFQNNRPGNLAADLIVQPREHVRFRGDLAYNIEQNGVQSATTDIEVTARRASIQIGTRYNRQPGIVVPEFVRVQGTYNQGERLPERAPTSFLQGGASLEVSKHLVVRAKTNVDFRTGTFVESRFAVDVRFQCWAIILEYIDRTRESGFSRGEDEIRFSVNLLGLGTAFRAGLGTGENGLRTK